MPGNPKDLIRHLDRLEEEAAIRQDETPLSEAEINLRFLRGQQWPSTEGPASPYRPESAQYRFVMNLVNQLMKRKTALITDSRPQIDVVARSGHRKQSASVYKQVTSALWDEANFDQVAARELVRAGSVGSTVCLPTWNETAMHGRGNIEFNTYDPRQVKLDPGVVRAVNVQKHAEYAMVREVVALNAIRERYKVKGREVQPTVRWSRYGRRTSRGGTYRGIATAMQRPWRRRDEDDITDSASPRSEIRYTWFKDWERDDRGEPLWSKPRHIRYVADAEGIVLKDEKLRWVHGQIPIHILDWDIELEHPWGIPEISGLRRIQYTLNRIVGQITENVILTNRVKVIADTNAVDPKTWDAITANPNGIYIRKRQGNALTYELPKDALPPYVLQAVQLLMQAFDIVTGMSETAAGRMPKGSQNLSGVALDTLQIQAQSIIRLEARAFENWLERIFQQVLALVWQYFTDDRLMHLLGPTGELLEFAFKRQELIRDDRGGELPLETAWQDFEFKVLPGSSLAMTRIQKGVMAMNLFQAGLIPGEDVLRAAEWANPAETIQRARQEAALGLGPGAQGGRASRKMQKMPGATKRQAIGV